MQSANRGRNNKEGEIIKENTVKSTIDYIHEDLQDDSSNWDLIFQRIKVKRFAHTMKRLEEAAGCKPDWRVVKRIVSQNWPAFEKGMSEREGYRLSTLAHLISNQYGKWEQAILLEDADSKRTTGQKRNKPRIEYDALERTESEQEGLGDISEWLDMFDDVI